MNMVLDDILSPPVLEVDAGEWTPDLVHARFVDALETMHGMPSPRPQGYGTCMPIPLREYKDAFAQAVEEGGWKTLTEAEQKALYRRTLKPTIAHISRMDKTFDWLRFVSKQEGIVIIGRALGRPTRQIRMMLKSAGFYGRSGAALPPSTWTVNRWHAKGLNAICRRLNGG